MNVSRRKGFTLIELLVVLAIVGTLLTIAVPSYVASLEHARETALKNSLHVVRAAIEHNLLYNGPQRLWYSGPLFRHERPQKGRYRQYHTFGAEALGFPGPDIDVELLAMTRRLWQKLGIDGVELQINTIGSAEERRAFRERLIALLSSR